VVGREAHHDSIVTPGCVSSATLTDNCSVSCCRPSPATLGHFFSHQISREDVDGGTEERLGTRPSFSVLGPQTGRGAGSSQSPRQASRAIRPAPRVSYSRCGGKVWGNFAKSPQCLALQRAHAERVGFERFSSSKILVLACAVQWLSVCSDLAFMMR